MHAMMISKKLMFIMNNNVVVVFSPLASNFLLYRCTLFNMYVMIVLYFILKCNKNNRKQIANNCKESSGNVRVIFLFGVG